MKKRGSWFSNKRCNQPMLGQIRGQVTIFIIIAIIIVGAVVAIYVLRPSVEVGTGFDADNPIGFIQNCLEEDIESTVNLISSQGGSIDPEFYYSYQGENIEYLCYTSEYYRTCVVQQPLLNQHVETEIKNDISEETTSCFNSLVENYKNEGYTVTLDTGRTEIELLPKRIVTNFDGYVLTVSKGETARYDSFNVVLNNNLYELVSIANSIIEWETKYGDAETTLYMSYYKDLKVEKLKQQDGTTIYILTDRNTENKFQFASRSVALPPGYGTSGIATN